MQIKGTDYMISYQPDLATVIFEGILRLHTNDNGPIEALLDEAVRLQRQTDQPNLIRLDVRALKFLNSSGFNALSRFVLKTRGQTRTRVVIRGSEKVLCQQKLLRSLQDLSPRLQVEWN